MKSKRTLVVSKHRFLHLDRYLKLKPTRVRDREVRLGVVVSELPRRGLNGSSVAGAVGVFGGRELVKGRVGGELVALSVVDGELFDL
jgi:hypothetical protein